MTLTLLLSQGCKHQNEVKENGPKVPVAEYIAGERLTEEGENLQGVYSQNGQRILFVSRNRREHRNAQAYEKNLSQNKENRITFQNGDVSNPQYVPGKEEIIYASSTDELKENSPFLREKLKQEGPPSSLPPELQAPTEIYLHHLDGTGMTRLTQHPGFDGWPKPTGRERFMWTYMEKNQLHIKTMSFNGSADLKLSQKNSGQFTVGPKATLGAWIAYSEDFKNSSLWIQQNHKNIELATELKGLKTDPAWDVTGTVLLFAFQSAANAPFQLYSVNIDGSCLTRQSQSQADERYPSLSPDGSSIIYSSNAKKGWQIYRRTWTRPCPLPPK